MTLFHYLASAIIVITTIFAQNSFAYNRRCNKEFFFVFLAIRQSHEPYNYDHPTAPTRSAEAPRLLHTQTHTRHARLDEEATLLVPLYGKIITHTHTCTHRGLPPTHMRESCCGGRFELFLLPFVFCFVLLRSSLTYPHIIGINIFRFVIISLALQHHTRLRKRNHVRVAAVFKFEVTFCDRRSFIHSQRDKVALIRKQKLKKREKTTS